MAPFVLIGVVLGLAVGTLVAGLTGSFGSTLLVCGLFGCLGGWAVHLDGRLRRLESATPTDPVSSPEPEPTPRVAPVATQAVTVARAAAKTVPAPAKSPSREAISRREPTDDRAWSPAPATVPPDEEIPPSSTDRAMAAVKEWFSRGNVPVKVGVVVLLFGVGFFIKYAIDRQLFSFPVWARLTMVAIFGVVVLAIGWRLRHKQPLYALNLQGGGVGILYLTTYAAFEFYALLPATVAFGAMVGITVVTGVLAVVQDSRALITLGVAGGFLAPLLATTETASHVALFSYYAVLNAAILTVAWFKTWRALNLLGFVFTFVVASLWGYQGYRPEHFATTEPFLVLFVVMYAGIAMLFALRRPPNLRGFVDSTLVFGTPLIGFTLQTRLVESESGLAWTAGGLAALYAVLGTAIWRVRDLRMLALSFAGLAILFVAVALPLALDDRWAGAAWAAQGAAMAWFGMRNGSRPLAFAGVALQVVAAVAHVRTGLLESAATPIANGPFLASVLLAVAGWTTTWTFDHSKLSAEKRRILARLALGWGGVWWFWSGVREITQFMDDGTRSAWLGFVACSAVATMVASRLLGWRQLNALGIVLLPAMVAILPYGFGIGTQPHPLGNYLWLAWPVALTVQYVFLRYGESGYPRLTPYLHVGAYWALLLLVVNEARWSVGTLAGGDWPLATAVVSAVVLCAGDRHRALSATLAVGSSLARLFHGRHTGGGRCGLGCDPRREPDLRWQRRAASVLAARQPADDWCDGRGTCGLALHGCRTAPARYAGSRPGRYPDRPCAPVDGGRPERASLRGRSVQHNRPCPVGDLSGGSIPGLGNCGARWHGGRSDVEASGNLDRRRDRDGGRNRQAIRGRTGQRRHFEPRRLVPGCGCAAARRGLFRTRAEGPQPGGAGGRGARAMAPTNT